MKNRHKLSVAWESNHFGNLYVAMHGNPALFFALMIRFARWSEELSQTIRTTKSSSSVPGGAACALVADRWPSGALGGFISCSLTLLYWETAFLLAPMCPGYVVSDCESYRATSPSFVHKLLIREPVLFPHFSHQSLPHALTPSRPDHDCIISTVQQLSHCPIQSDGRGQALSLVRRGLFCLRPP